MEVSRIPSIQNHTSSDQRQNNGSKEQIAKNKPDQTNKQLEDTVRQLNLEADQSQVYIEFKLHEKSGEYYVRMIDSKTNEVIREIPSKKILDYFSDMSKFTGLHLNKKI